MPDFNELPQSFPSMGAEFTKPYMAFDYAGTTYRVENLKGGHNGRVAAACRAAPPQWDVETQRWVVPVLNNLIDIDFSEHPHFPDVLGSKSRLNTLKIVNNPRSSYLSTGSLLASGEREERPRFPVDCIFRMFIRATVPGRWSFINVRPFRLVAKGLTEWPPPVGTTYTNEDHVELFPEWLPYVERVTKPVVRILPGDTTVLTRVFKKEDTGGEPPSGIGPLLRKAINRMT